MPVPLATAYPAMHPAMSAGQTSKDAQKREEAENRYESALADINGLTEKNAQLKAQVDAAEAPEPQRRSSSRPQRKSVS